MYPHQTLQLLREQKRLSQKQVYTAVDMKQQTYNNKEKGRRKLKPHEKKALAEYHEVPESMLDEPVTLQTPVKPTYKECIEKFFVLMQNGLIQTMHRLPDDYEPPVNNSKVKGAGKKKKGK